MTAAAKKRSPLRWLGDVRKGEWPTALGLAGTLFTLLCAYYVLKVARESLMLAQHASETKVYFAAGQAILLVPTVWAYGWLSTRVGRVRLYTIATGFFAMNLVVFAVLYLAHVDIGMPFFVWIGVFNVFVVAQLWAFANDVYSEEQGRRLFPIIGIGSATGAIVGAYGAGPLGDAVGSIGLLVLPVALLLLTILGVRWVHSRTGAGTAPATPKKGARDGWALLFSDKYLVLIAVMMLLLNCENTIGEYLLDRVMKSDLQHQILASGVTGNTDLLLEGKIRDFKSIYFGAFNSLSFALQLFVTGRVMKKGGAALAVLILPAVSLLGQFGMIVTAVPLLAVAIAKVTENAVDYSIQNTGRNALFLVTPAAVKYKVKVLIDSVIVRFGDVLAGGTVLLAAGLLHLGIFPFVIVNVALTVGWLFVVLALRRIYLAKLKADPPKAEKA